MGGGSTFTIAGETFRSTVRHPISSLQHPPRCRNHHRANPDDLHPTYIRMLRHFPFNRLSMGIQTFNDATLSVLQRRHNARQALEAFWNCREAGFGNISIRPDVRIAGRNTRHMASRPKASRHPASRTHLCLPPDLRRRNTPSGNSANSIG